VLRHPNRSPGERSATGRAPRPRNRRQLDGRFRRRNHRLPPQTGSSTFKGVDLPASDPFALAVGATTLHASRRTGAYIGETVWYLPPLPGGPSGGGGGSSRLFPRPAYQNDITPIGDARDVPDVAAHANSDTGMALAISDGGHRNILGGAGGVPPLRCGPRSPP
jgi:hypothetical protein